VVVVRVEDASLGDLKAVFSDRLRAFLRPHRCLTPGSVVLIGSQAHLPEKLNDKHCQTSWR